MLVEFPIALLVVRSVQVNEGANSVRMGNGEPSLFTAGYGEPYQRNPRDRQRVEKRSKVLGKVLRAVASWRLFRWNLPTTRHSEHPKPIGERRGEAVEHMCIRTTAGQEEQRITVAAVVDIVKPGAVDHHKLIGSRGRT